MFDSLLEMGRNTCRDWCCHLYAYAVMLALLFCSVLPLSQLQNAMTFNANYLRFINERQARSRFLLELLG